MSKGDDQVWIAQHLGNSHGAQGMSTIDKIMTAALTLGDQRLMATHNRATREDVREAETEMRNLIAAALADARRDGAEVMREACEKAVWLTRIESELPDSDDKGVSGWLEFAEDRVRRSPIPMPLPDGKRQAVLLTSAELLLASGRVTPLTFVAEKTYRAIEAAALAKNNLEVRRD